MFAISDYFYERGQGKSSYLQCALSSGESGAHTSQEVPRSSLCWENKDTKLKMSGSIFGGWEGGQQGCFPASASVQATTGK